MLYISGTLNNSQYNEQKQNKLRIKFGEYKKTN